MAKLKKEAKVVPVSPEQWSKIEDAFSVLRDKDQRQAYDISVGLSEKRRARIDLRPLGFFSKSLQKAQRNWPVWERELYAVLMSIVHFKPILCGATVVIHTDHLNNTTLSENLSNPDKILRMLLKVDSLVRAEWVFCPRENTGG
jgi:hypothetical protein